MDYRTALLTFGVVFLLVGLIGQVKLKELEVGTSNSIARAILGVLGLILILLSLYRYTFNERIEETVSKKETSANGNVINGSLIKGIYVGDFTTDSNTTGVSIRTELKQVEDRMVGKYSYGMKEGTIDGNLKNNVILFEWYEPGGFGHGKLYLKENGKRFSGTWGYKESSDNGGAWNGHLE
ncbi:hypothetical protein [Candidatus Nitrotoga sp. 1052]|uniref:hypothetical protein n=1 Tax=Candidatus Nitrotoga sp. 1052 TaxID=2886964 RepID=UPI001EF6709D|nr:hypothetical protein [Candidatus Nitrotoga sp. 1052]CAH1092386.1 hypothetical protein NTG1052_940033 [Candidatus Nitrotoga sp. 1052]